MPYRDKERQARETREWYRKGMERPEFRKHRVAISRAYRQKRINQGLCSACGKNPLVVRPSGETLRRCQPCTVRLRKNDMNRVYKVTPEQYFATLEKQNNKCAVCGSSEKLGIDHDHTTGEFRGILCRKCNSGIGHLGDTAEGLRRALRYLEG